MTATAQVYGIKGTPAQLTLLQTLKASARVYAPQCVMDLDRNGLMDLVGVGCAPPVCAWLTPLTHRSVFRPARLCTATSGRSACASSVRAPAIPPPCPVTSAAARSAAWPVATSTLTASWILCFPRPTRASRRLWSTKTATSRMVWCCPPFVCVRLCLFVCVYIYGDV